MYATDHSISGRTVKVSITQSYTHYLPLLTLLLYPAYGVVFGLRPLLATSLLYTLLHLAVHQIPGSYVRLNTFAQILLFLLPWTVPPDVVPYPFIWIYHIFLQISEPYLLLQEVFFIVSQLTEFTVFILIRGSDLHYNDGSDDASADSYNATKGKCPPSYLRYFALISIVGYSMTFTIISKYFEVDCWLGTILFITLLNHFTTWYMDSSLWENSFIFFISTIVLYVMRHESEQRQSCEKLSHLLVVEKSHNTSSSSSFFVRSTHNWLWQMSDSEKNIVSQVFLTPLFIGKVTLRLCSIIWCNGDCLEFLWSMYTEKKHEECLTDTNNSDTSSSTKSWFRYSPLFYRLCIYFVVIQLVAGQLQDLNNESSNINITWLTNIMPGHVIWGRIFQVFLVNGFHLHSLFTRYL